MNKNINSHKKLIQVCLPALKNFAWKAKKVSSVNDDLFLQLRDIHPQNRVSVSNIYMSEIYIYKECISLSLDNFVVLLSIEKDKVKINLIDLKEEEVTLLVDPDQVIPTLKKYARA